MPTTGTLHGSSAPTSSAAPPAGRSVATVELAVIALLSLAPYLWRKAVGADHIPAADSWAYEKIFESFHFDRTIRLVDWNDINLLGILPVAEAWTAIFGFGRDQLHLLGSFMAAVALLGFRSILCTLHVPRRLAALILIGTYSGFVGVAGTFQSDAFAVSGAIWAVAFALKLWARAQQPPLLDEHTTSAGGRVLGILRTEPVLAGAAACAAFYGFSVRQQAGTSAAVALLVLWACRSRYPLAWKVFSITFVALAAPFFLWRSGMANGGEVEIGFHPRSILAAAQWNTVSLGLLVLWACRSRYPIAWKVFAITFVTLAAPFTLWRNGMENGGAVEIGFHPRSILAAGQWNTVSLGLLIALGVAWLATRPALRRGSVVWCIALAVGLLAAGHITRQRAPQERGVMTELWRHFGEWQSALPLLLVFAFAAWGTVWVAQRWWAERRTPPTVSASALLARLFAICVAGELLVAMTSTYFSRYSLFSGMIALAWIFLNPVTVRAATVAVTALVAGLSYWELDQTVMANDATARAGRIVACLGFQPAALDAGFFWNGMHYDGIASSRDRVHVDDGLPNTIDQYYFPEMVRSAVLLSDRPEPSADTTVIGPIHSGALLPWNEHDYWLVVRTTDVEAGEAERCAAST